MSAISAGSAEIPRLPGLPQLSDLLGLPSETAATPVPALVERTLLAPLADFLARPSKGFRGRLVELGYLLGGGRFDEGEAGNGDRSRTRAACAALAAVIEELHAGSLIVDDIEDGSLVRRGAPALHVQHGVARALNAGNWLYFWPLERVRALGLAPGVELGLYRLIHRIMLRAHAGQALDLGVRIDEVPRSQIRAVCLASLELKSGALMSLGLGLGGVLAGADETRLDMLDELGRRLGTALQFFDDVGNLGDAELAKRFEDLQHRRPSWIWSVVAEELSEEAFLSFLTAVDRLPDEAPLLAWLAAHDLATAARVRAREFLEDALVDFSSRLARAGGPVVEESTIRQIRELAEKVANSYG